MTQRIWIIGTPLFWPTVGGVQTYIKELSESIGSDRCVVLAPAVNTDQSVEGAPAVPVSLIPQIRHLRFLAVIALILRRRRRAGLIAAMTDPTGFAMALVRMFSREPLFVVVYGQELLASGAARRALRWITLRTSTGVLAISAYAAELAEATGAQRRRIHILPPPVRSVPRHGAVAEGDLRTRYGLHGTRILLSVGRLEPRKNHRVVIDALDRLVEEDVAYVIVGDGPTRPALEERAAACPRRIVFTGFVDREELDAWYRMADVFILPSRSDGSDAEGFGIVYVEAQSAGIPTIAGRGGGTADAVQDGLTGYLVSPDSADEIADRLMLLLSDPGRATAMGEAGMRFADGFKTSEFHRRLHLLLTRAKS